VRTAREINELHQLDDDCFVDTNEAAAILTFSAKSLAWYRKRRPEASPKFYTVGGRLIRYRMGDLRRFLKKDPSSYHVPRTIKEG
jgi:hypothetical protein